MEKRPDRGLVDQVFSSRNFARTLSYREFVTSISLTLLLLAIYSILDYYSNEDWIETNETTIKWTFFCILMPTNHIFYKAEHKRPNNFIGRNFHDYIFFLLFASLYKLSLFFYGSRHSFGVDGVGSAIVFFLVFFILVMLFELTVAILKRGLALLRWQIL